MIRHFRPEKYDLEISVEWPDISGAAIPASRLIIRDMNDPERKTIDTITAMTIYCTSGNITWAEVEMLSDLEDRPVLRGRPYHNGVTILTGIFVAKIMEFRSGYSYRAGFKSREGAVHV